MSETRRYMKRSLFHISDLFIHIEWSSTRLYHQLHNTLYKVHISLIIYDTLQIVLYLYYSPRVNISTKYFMLYIFWICCLFNAICTYTCTISMQIRLFSFIQVLQFNFQKFLICANRGINNWDVIKSKPVTAKFITSPIKVEKLRRVTETNHRIR